MDSASKPSADVISAALDPSTDLNFQLPDPDDENLSEYEFQRQVDAAWQICDRFDLQTDIWRGRIMRTVRDREKRGGDGRGTGFLNWLRDREITKSQAYSLIELANSADTLLQEGMLEPEAVNNFSKRAFIETAHSAPEVQQLVSDAAQRGEQITRREVRQISDEWTAMTSDLLPSEIKEKAANNTIPARYLAPLVKEMEKLPQPHQETLRTEVMLNPDIDTLKQVTAEARYLAKYLEAAVQVQALDSENLDLEQALEEALRIGCLNATADLVKQASLLEQATAKLYSAWTQMNKLAERVYVDSGASTPHLRRLLNHLEPLTSQTLEVQLGDADSPLSHMVRLQLLSADGGSESSES
jgi:hypothetical protein